MNKHSSSFENHQYHEKKPLPHYHDVEGHKLYYTSCGGWISKEWAELFLEKWNQAVRLWDEGRIFVPEFHSGAGGMYSDRQLDAHKEYAVLCCTWIIPNRMVEPHCVAEGG